MGSATLSTFTGIAAVVADNPVDHHDFDALVAAWPASMNGGGSTTINAVNAAGQVGLEVDGVLFDDGITVPAGVEIVSATFGFDWQVSVNGTNEPGFFGGASGSATFNPTGSGSDSLLYASHITRAQLYAQSFGWSILLLGTNVLNPGQTLTFQVTNVHVDVVWRTVTPAWTAVDPGTTVKTSRDVAWSPALGIFCACGNSDGLGNAAFLTSPDGTTWTQHVTVLANTDFRRVAWSPALSLFVAVSPTAGTTNQVLTSPDGINWTSRVTPDTAGDTSAWEDVCWSPALGLFVAVASAGPAGAPDNLIMTSANGTAWTAHAAPSTQSYKGVCWSSTLALFVAVGSNAIMTSANGTVWTDQTPADASSLMRVLWADTLNLFVAAGEASGTFAIFTSPNGTAWTGRDADGQTFLFGIGWDPTDGLLVAPVELGNSDVVTSTDGITWATEGGTDPGSTFSDGWSGVAFSTSLGLFVAVSTDPATPGGTVMMTRLGASVTVTVTNISPASGGAAGGTAVTITGTNFQAGARVNIGGVECTGIVVVSSTSITCFTGAHAVGLVDVTVTNTDFGFGTLASGYTYTADSSSTGVLTSLSPSHGVMAGGTSVTLVGQFFALGATVKFGDDAATSVVVVDGQHITCLTPQHQAGVVDVTLDDSTVLEGAYTYDLYTAPSTTPLLATVRYDPNLTIHEALNSTPNTCEYRQFTVAPVAGEDLQVNFGDSFGLLFAGVILTVEMTYEGLPTNNVIWNVHATDYVWLLNRLLPFGAWNNVDAGQVVLDLLSDFAQGFSNANVQLGLTPVTVVFDGAQNFAACLSQLANLCAGRWYVDYLKNLHFGR
jgi:hypothetical protein